MPKLRPYTGEDVGAIVASVANRPRSRSVAQGNNPSNGSPSGSNPIGVGHNRRLSNSQGSIHARSGSIAAGGNDRRSFGRQSMSQGQMQAIIDENRSSSFPEHARAPSPTDTKTDAVSGGGAIDWGNVSSPAKTRLPSTGAGLAFNPPVSPERTLRAGATSPSTLRRLVQQSR